MRSRIRTCKRSEINLIDASTLIERLKKVRALNCDPSSVGIDSYVVKRISSNKLNILTKFL